MRNPCHDERLLFRPHAMDIFPQFPHFLRTSQDLHQFLFSSQFFHRLQECILFFLQDNRFKDLKNVLSCIKEDTD